MKKFLLLSVLLFGISYNVLAANGDIAGNIYSTDILAYVNGKTINSYNIGGKTAVIVEDLSGDADYGFNVWYSDDTRTLTVNSNGSNGYGELEVQRGKSGKITGNIYETDIKVIFNSKEVKGYNIGGKTAVCIEDLGTVTEDSPNYGYGYSEYLCNFNWDGDNRIVSLNTFQSGNYTFDKYPDHKLKFLLTDNKLSCSFDQMNPYYCYLEFNLTEEFKTEKYIIKPVFFDNEEVGIMYIDEDGFPVTRFDITKFSEHTKDIAVVLSYEEAKQYVTDNFNIIDMREDEFASIYIAEADNVKYLLFAMKNGGFLVQSSYDEYITEVEFREDENGDLYLYSYPHAGTPGSGTVWFAEPCDSKFYHF